MQFYNMMGLSGMIYNGETYYYEKNTLSNRLLGTKIHSSFMKQVTIPGTRFRVDGLVGNNIFELKPYNRRSLRAGVNQLIKYNNAYGGTYNMILVFY